MSVTFASRALKALMPSCFRGNVKVVMKKTALCALWLAGCVSSSSITCPDGVTCPSGSTCVTVVNPNPNPQLNGATTSVCASPAQVTACDGLADGASCIGIDGSCFSGVCLGPAGCGNAYVDSGELCDDGNQASGDGCSSDCRSDETCGNSIIDPVKELDGVLVGNEQCDDNARGHDGCASCKLEEPAWSQLLPGPGPTDARRWFGLVYDTVRKQFVLFGGGAPQSVSNPDRPLNDLWQTDGVTWLQLAPTFVPAARHSFAMAYDANRHRVVMFGGSNGDLFGDTWEWDGNHWTVASATAIAPSRRIGHAMAYDARRKVVVMFGGTSGDGTYPADTWEWNGTTWKSISIAGPPGRARHAMGYDPARGVIVLTGGDETGGVYVGDTWEYDGTTWSQKDDGTSASALPALLVGSSLAYDTASARMIAYGGEDARGTNTVAGTYAWNGSAWNDLQQTSPGPRQGYAMATDPFSGQVMLYGGFNQYASRYCPQGECFGGFADAWFWDGSAWTQAAATQPPPGVRENVAAAQDPRTATMLLVGGDDGLTGDLDETWTLDRAGWHSFAGPWTTVDSTSGKTLGASGAAVAWDTKREQAVLFGGHQADSTRGGFVIAETYLWNGASWSLAAPSMSPPARYQHAMAYDKSRDRVVLFGGHDDIGALFADTWEWNGTTWSPITTAHVPPALYSHSLAYDPVRRRVVLFGGVLDGATYAMSDETWTFDGVDWRQEAPTVNPPGRAFHAMAWDASRETLVMFGGGTSATPLGDAWEWNGADWQAVVVGAAPPARQALSMVSANEGSGITIFGGSAGYNGVFGDMWRLRWDGPLEYEQCAPGGDDDHDGAVGCNDDDCWENCRPLCPPGTTCAAGDPICGDGVCQPFEDCHSCTADCASCSKVVCGDTFCDAPESVTTCPGDCGP